MAWQHPARPARHGTARCGSALPPLRLQARCGEQRARPGRAYPLALHRARHLVIVQVPLELGRHDPCRGRGPGGAPGGRVQPLSGLRAGPAANGRCDGSRAAPSSCSAERRAIHRGWGRGLWVGAWPLCVGVVCGCGRGQRDAPRGGGVESAARLAVRRPHPSPRSARRSAARGKFPPPGPPCGPASRPSALLHLLLPRAPSPSKARYGGPPAWLPHDPELPKGTAGAAPPRGAVRGAPLAPGDGAVQSPPPCAAPGVPWGSPPPRPRPRLPAAALARGRANILASATARCRSFASGRHGGSTGIWKVPAAL